MKGCNKKLKIGTTGHGKKDITKEWKDVTKIWKDAAWQWKDVKKDWKDVTGQ